MYDVNLQNKATFEQTPLNELQTALHVPVLTMFNVISFKEWSGNLEHSDILILQEKRADWNIDWNIFCKIISSKKRELMMYIIMRLASWRIDTRNVDQISDVAYESLDKWNIASTVPIRPNMAESKVQLYAGFTFGVYSEFTPGLLR